MQQGISRAEVYEPTVNVTVGGEPVDVSEMRSDRDMPDPVAGNALRAADVSITAVHGDDVSTRVPTPWDPGSAWPPVPEAPAAVSMDTAAGSVSVLSGGRVIAASGGTSSRDVTVDLADRYQSLDQTISWEQVAEAMPSISDDGMRRFVGMWTPSITDTILRRCGWYSTPPPQGFSVLSVPAQGTMWAERGSVASSRDASTGTGFPRFGVTPWGVGTLDANATYNLVSSYSIKSQGRIELSAMTMTTGGTGRVTADTGTGGGLVRLAWSDQTGNVWIGGAGMTLTAVATVPRTDGLLYATIEYVSDTSVRVILRSGTSIQTATVTVPSAVATGTVATAGILVDGSRSAGFQVAFPGSSAALMNWAPNAQIHARVTDMNRLTYRPPVESGSCVDLLDQQCGAEGATYWIDETGVLHWWDLQTLENRGPVATLTSTDDILGFDWSYDLSSMKSGVTVKWTDAAQAFSSRATIDLWQGSGSTIQPGISGEQQIVSVPNDEVWLMPHLPPQQVGTINMDGFNRGQGSWFGGIISGAGTGSDSWAHLSGTLNVTIEKITDTAYKIITSWSGSAQAVQRTPHADAATLMWRARRDFDLPILRGKSKITLTDRDYTSTITGPATAPELVIDAGWWIQSEAQAKISADYAASRVTIPRPVLSAIDIIPIPGLQLGDIVTAQDSDVSRLSIRGIVTSDSRSVVAGMDMKHSVRMRPLDVDRIGVTWREWALEARPKTWREWYLKQTPSTWREWADDPLGKE